MIFLFTKLVERKLLSIDREKNDILFTGNINIDLNEFSCNNAKARRSMMEQLGLTQLIKTTRYGQNKNSLLDVILTNFTFIAGSGVCDVKLVTINWCIVHVRKYIIKEQC